VHEINGNIVTAGKMGARRLPKEYKKVQFIKNEQGERVMRLRLAGGTVDISENKAPAEVVANGDTTTE
jgi:hypothetical protein